MNINEVAQWVIDNRYPKREFEKLSDHELYHGLIEKIELVLQQNSGNTNVLRLREKLAEMQGFLQKPEHEFNSMHDWMDNEENKIAIYRVMKMIDALPPVA